ncbi:transcription antitermination factor NusB [Rubritalea marina]|uniref:transcription antitermination factor NusB n=1 Tax=Rubritalea marina TaxID=361055 RepID=UPI0003633E28|nr:transcription antitermination factor NusB [Rubritalea marina]
MHSRRAIRESVIQFLYCSDLEGGADAPALSDSFWDLSLETESNKIIKASAKAALHLNQGRQARHSKFVNRLDEASAFITAESGAEKVQTTLKQLQKLESKWQSLIDQIQRNYDPGVETPVPQLLEGLEELFSLNSQLSEARKRLELQLQDFPALSKRLTPIVATINGLQRVSDRIHMVKNPDKFATHPDIKSIQETAESMQMFRDEADSIARGIFKQKASLDEALETVVDNYKPERIDPVDRAILRLGAYEIMHVEAIPAPVTINECIEISRRFGSTESPRFINGVLDKIAKA